MVKQVKTASTTFTNTMTQASVFPVAEIQNSNVNPQLTTAVPVTTVNNIGIQANNLYISGVTLSTTNSTPLPLGYTSIPYGSQEYINIGAYPNDGTGDPLRVAFDKINNNFSNLFATTFSTSESITTGLTSNQVILEQPVNTFMQGVFQIRSYDPTNIDMQDITLSASITNDANSVKFTGYATLFDGNALCRYDMDVFNDSVRILVNPLINTDIHHYISYQVTNSGAVEGPSIALNGYPSDFIMSTEDDIELIAEGG
jgi:hypothetical protein